MAKNMTPPNPHLKASEPKSVFTKPLKADFKALLKALSKGVGHTAVGKWEELGTDAVETLSAIGLSTEPEELAFLLIRRSLTRALFDLVGDSASEQLASVKKDESLLLDQLQASMTSQEVHLDHRFLDRPENLPLLTDAQALLRQWLTLHDIADSTAKAIAHRLPSYFVYSLNQEWRRNAKAFRPILDAIDTPFSRASEREWAWLAYAALLDRRVHEGIFDEPFSLGQLFVPLNAYYFDHSDACDAGDQLSGSIRSRKRKVVSLHRELTDWLGKSSRQDAIRVISGGPGSGKSSFARVFAATVARGGALKVLFVPLHLIDTSRDLVEEVGRFTKDEGILLQNPLDPESAEPSLLVIFDGLDELASQGKAAAETARAFLREVERTVEKRNLQHVRLRVLISGRELVVQENESELRRPGQVLFLLPYFVGSPRTDERSPSRHADGEEYDDADGLLKTDLRDTWWRTYGSLTGRSYKALPKELARKDLDEITAQPLLNYLVALSLSRNKLDFSRDVNLNSIYADLVTAVHERGYEQRPYAPIRHMGLAEFSRVLEEVGLAAWHGDGRTTTVREIEEHCRASGLGAMLDVFQEGAKSGVTRLLAAFFFRQHGQRASGDPTFVFTHKSFGEYLTARRVVRAMERVCRELERRSNGPDEGWDEREALKYWAQICGPSPITRYLRTFVLNELRLRQIKELREWQPRLAGLLSYVLAHGMPIEQLQLVTFKEALFQSRNAEESLLVALNACAVLTNDVSPIKHPDPTAFGAWFRRIQGQRTGPESVVAADCLSFLDLSGVALDIGDFYGSDLSSSVLRGARAHFSCFERATLANADMRQGFFGTANFNNADLSGAKLQGAHLEGASFVSADLQRANLEGTQLTNRFLEHTRLVGTRFIGANLRSARLMQADLTGVDLREADLDGADLRGAKLRKTLRPDERLKGARLDGAQFVAEDGPDPAGEPRKRRSSKD